MKENNLSYPLIIKHTGQEKFIKHLNSIVLNEKGYENYCNKFKSEKDVKIENVGCLVQKFSNHGDHAIKMYRLNDTNYFDYRPSLLDVIEGNEFTKTLPDCFWSFRTCELERGDFTKTTWKKYRKEDFIKNLMENKENNSYKNFIEDLMCEVERFIKSYIFGLDLLFDYENKKFLVIDVNLIPGYKIKTLDAPQEFKNLFIKKYSH